MNFTNILGNLGLDTGKWAGFLNGLGLDAGKWGAFLNGTIQLAIMVLAAWLVLLLTRKVVGPIVIKITKKTSFSWDDKFFTPQLFSRLGLLLAPITVRFILSFIKGEYIHIVKNFVDAWIVIAAVMFISALLYGANRIYESLPVSKDRPIRVFIQLIVIFVWCAAVMVIISIFTGIKVGGLLGGLTAFAAVIMLIFQDTILGFVAGIQMNANKMVRVGDWIEMPSRGADGDVIEIGLNTVKVQNWDKTIVTIPTHKLVQESFTNWRGMEQSGGRRIKRSVNVDVSSIRYLTEEDLSRLRGSAMLKDYIEKKVAELARFNAGIANPLDERRLTNIGTFREYLEVWLARNPDINQEMTHMVRQLQPGPTGLPLEVYCFSAHQAWIQYERVQSDIFDHIYAVMPLFGLRAYEYGGIQYPVEGTKR